MIGGGAGNPADYINVSGTLAYYGRQNIKDTITVPIAVEYSGTLEVTVDQNSTKPLQGTLIVQDGNGSTNNVSVYMTGASSEVTLDNYDTLECDNGYDQASGTLKTLDATTCTLQLGAGGGTANITGGSLWIDTTPNTVGTLNVNGNMNFDGALTVTVLGYAPNNNAGPSDVLFVSGDLYLNPDTSTLSVIVSQGYVQTDFWIVIESPNSIAGNFSSESNDTLADLTFGPPNQPQAGKYRITCNNG